MNSFWNVVKEKEMMKKEIPIIIAKKPREQTARRRGKSGFWMR